MTPFDTRNELSSEVASNLPEEQRLRADIPSQSPTPLPKGTRWEDIAEFAGTVSHEDAEAMRIAIEEGCERIETGSW